MLEDEADEDVVETRLGEGKAEDVCPLERDVPQRGRPSASLRRLERFDGDVDAGEPRVRTVADKGHGLGTDAAACLEHGAAGRISRIVVKQLCERGCLVEQTRILALGIAVNVSVVRVE